MLNNLVKPMMPAPVTARPPAIAFSLTVPIRLRRRDPCGQALERQTDMAAWPFARYILGAGVITQ
jgi:hypothetical protein